MNKRPPLLSIVLLSSGALAYEILLMRLFSIIQWHHFAYMIISLALLGYGMSGTFISLAQQYISPKFNFFYIILIILFAISSPVAFLIAQEIPFNAEEVLFNAKQIYYLLTIFLVLAIPFFFAASGICLALRYYTDHVSSIYGYNLLGAGFGSIGIIALLYFFLPQTILFFICVIILLAAIIAVWELKLKGRRIMSVVLVLLAIVIVTAFSPVELRLSPYKGLEQSMRIRGTRVIGESSSPLGLLTVLESTEIPFRHVPGLSLNNHQEPLEQLGIFIDGDNMTVLTKKAKQRGQLAYLDQISSALPYHLSRPDRVLILGSGGGSDVLLAQYHGIPHIHAVEMNPQIPAFIHNRYAEYAGRVFDNTATRLYIDEIRGFVKQSKQEYNLIQLAISHGFNGSSSGVYALSESYLYTVEALRDYFLHLSPDGYLAITGWIKMPPRDTLKLFATAIESLKGMGVKRPQDQLVLIRSWQTSTLLIKQGKFTKAELQTVQSFCDERSFDIAFDPSITRVKANRYNILRKPFFYLATTSIAGEQNVNFIQNYKFNITPATDDKPYFNLFFKWSSLAEIIRLRQQGSTPLLESAYLILVATLAAALVISFILILLPLWLLRNESTAQTYAVNKAYVLTFFFLIGIAFLFIEIAFLQKFILFLHHPIYAISTGLASFLIFAGLGSHWSQKISKKINLVLTMKLVVSGVALFCLLYVFTLDHLFTFFGDRSLLVRGVVSVGLIGPLAILMGMPFPLALKSLVNKAEQLVPWAWGINGCASVISATLATLLAIHFGFVLLTGLAAFLYCVACWMFAVSE